MENEKKIAYFVGGEANGLTREISNVEMRVRYFDWTYLSRGVLDTKEFGRVQIYALEGLNHKEEQRLVDRIKKKDDSA